MTLSEYLVDYASVETAEKGWLMIAQELEKIPDEHRRTLCKANIESIENGNARDFRF